MQSVSPRIWTRVAVSISYDDNPYTTLQKFFLRFLIHFIKKVSATHGQNYAEKSGYSQNTEVKQWRS